MGLSLYAHRRVGSLQKQSAKLGVDRNATRQACIAAQQETSLSKNQKTSESYKEGFVVPNHYDYKALHKDPECPLQSSI